MDRPRPKPSIVGYLLPVALCLGVLVASCGKKGDPEPPIRMVPAPTTGLTVIQRGDRLILELPYPQTTAAGTPLPRVSGLAAWLLAWSAPEAAATTEGLEVDERQFLTGASPVRRIAEDELPEVVRGDRIVVSIPVPAPPEPGPGLPVVTVAVRTQGPASEESALSNRVTFPLIAAPAPPTGLEIRDLATGLRIRWEYPLGAAAEAAEEPAGAEGAGADEAGSGGEETVAGSAPEEAAGEPDAAEAAAGEPAGAPGLAGFNVYRRLSTERTYGPPMSTLGHRPRAFLDDSAAFGERYIYTVTAVASRKPILVESGLAEEVEVDYRDRFAPPVPKGLLALAEEGRVRLVWEVSPAPDVAGYRVFRRGPDTQEFRPVTEELLTATELVDRDLAPGATYSYRVTAVDRMGNESEPSPAAMATAR
ncbi:MAG TPA: fibronectin type III domain-containing protein [Thermoanaerobaculia bacterium]|nr:fibronectin type III domain-containing protein [Thermoanaerobaculia bacterium]